MLVAIAKSLEGLAGPRKLVVQFSFDCILPALVPRLSVAEVAHAGEEHGDSQTIGGVDDFGIALRTSGLNDCGRAGLGDLFDTVGEWEESVGSCDCAFQWKLCFHGAELGGIDAGHLPGTDADRLAGASINNGV